MVVAMAVVMVPCAMRVRVFLPRAVTMGVIVFEARLRWVTLVDVGQLRCGLGPTLRLIFNLAAVCWVSRLAGIGCAVHDEKLSRLNTYWQLNENRVRWSDTPVCTAQNNRPVLDKPSMRAH